MASSHSQTYRLAARSRIFELLGKDTKSSIDDLTRQCMKEKLSVDRNTVAGVRADFFRLYPELDPKKVIEVNGGPLRIPAIAIASAKKKEEVANFLSSVPNNETSPTSAKPATPSKEEDRVAWRTNNLLVKGAETKARVRNEKIEYIKGMIREAPSLSVQQCQELIKKKFDTKRTIPAAEIKALLPNGGKVPFSKPPDRIKEAKPQLSQTGSLEGELKALGDLAADLRKRFSLRSLTCTSKETGTECTAEVYKTINYKI